MTLETKLSEFARNVDVTEVGGDKIVDFDIDANENYEIQSGAVVEDGRVTEASVRFGRAPTYEDIHVDSGVLHTAWANMVNNVSPVGDYEADLSHFGHDVPHFRVEDMDVCEFVRVVRELHTLVSAVFQSGVDAMDERIEEYL